MVTIRRIAYCVKGIGTFCGGTHATLWSVVSLRAEFHMQEYSFKVGWAEIGLCWVEDEVVVGMCSPLFQNLKYRNNVLFELEAVRTQV